MASAGRRAAATAFGFAALIGGAIVFAPEGRLACRDPYVREASPDARWTLTVCPRPMLFAMPGSSSDAPGWVVLRDHHGAIRGVSGLAMLQLYGAASGDPIRWSTTRVEGALIFDLPLTDAANTSRRWLDDRIWRLRALFGLTPTDDEFH